MHITEDDSSGIEALQLETQRRVPRFTSIRSITPTGGVHGLTFPGTVTVFVAPAGSGVLHEIETSLSAGPTAVTELVNRLHAPADGRTALPLSEAAAQLTSLPVYAEVRYSNRTLMHSLCVPPEFEVGMVSLPYNGGEVDEQRLELVEYPAAGSSAALDAIAIVHPPTLSDVERHVLAELGPDSRGENLGPGLRCYAACAVGGALLLTVAATLCGSKTYSTADREKRELQNRLTDDAVSSLGPAATARELLAIRRAMLSEIEEA